jgi:hypothetical protein
MVIEHASGGGRQDQFKKIIIITINVTKKPATDLLINGIHVCVRHRVGMAGKNK